MPNGDDLYLTEYGTSLVGDVLIQNWYSTEKRRFRWERLRGTGSLYRLHTREAGLCPIDLVAKWSRVGQEVPGQEPDVISSYSHAEFNSPFEEFALLMELRNSRAPSGRRIYTHKPLAIYVPAQRVEPSRQGRKRYLFEQKAKNSAIEMDLHRQYILIYEWIKGVDVVQASERISMSEEDLEKLTLKGGELFRERGFVDNDRKPHHLIVRVDPEGRLVKDKDFQTLYAHVDFEMLQRTPEREEAVRASRRSEYLVRQRDRFDTTKEHEIPPQLNQVDVFGVDYIYGGVESTGGALWVVGRDPVLFDYFLPERWRRTPRKKLSQVNQVFYTLTKDNIHLVWRVSRVGEKPDLHPDDIHGREVLEHGFNSPFEEFALALELERKGIRTVYPRAIYRTGTETSASEHISDKRRYRRHRRIILPDGQQALRPDRNYITVWGYWNGPDELLAVRDGEYYTGMGLLHAYREGVLSKEDLDELLEKERRRLAQAGVEDLNLRPEHLMITRDHEGQLIRDVDGGLEVRLCNFELLRRSG
jgi:hypothetical protein